MCPVPCQVSLRGQLAVDLQDVMISSRHPFNVNRSKIDVHPNEANAQCSQVLFLKFIPCCGSHLITCVSMKNTSVKFHPGREVYDKGTIDFPNARSAMVSPLAKALFRIDGVSSVFFGPDFITVTKKDDDASWSVCSPLDLS